MGQDLILWARTAKIKRARSVWEAGLVHQTLLQHRATYSQVKRMALRPVDSVFEILMMMGVYKTGFPHLVQ